MFLLRFDMRAPGEGPTAITDLYDAALEMAAWGEQHAAAAVVVSEHHASSDGYLPSPLVLASAIAARTSTVPITVAALLVPLHDPVRLAEDMAVLDVASWLGDTAAASKSTADSIEALRSEGSPYRIVTPAAAVDYVRTHGFLALHPLCGGCPPELAWETLELVADRVPPEVMA